MNVLVIAGRCLTVVAGAAVHMVHARTTSHTSAENLDARDARSPADTFAASSYTTFGFCWRLPRRSRCPSTGNVLALTLWTPRIASLFPSGQMAVNIVMSETPGDSRLQRFVLIASILTLAVLTLLLPPKRRMTSPI